MSSLSPVPSLLLALILVLPPGMAQGWYPRLVSESLLMESSTGQAIGKNRNYILAPGEVLPDIARRCRIGYLSLVDANPGIDPWNPGDWQEIVLPYRTLLPAGAGPGITINLADYKLYLIWTEQGTRRVRIYPIGIGQNGWNSPEGEFEITETVESPSWTLPQALREEEQGSAIIPPGPENPLGDYWIGLSASGLGIHGTNQPYGVGRRVSHGCIRLYPDDIKDLIRMVSTGMAVNIVYQPIKLASDDGTLLVQVHPDYLGRITDPLAEALGIKDTLGWRGEIDLDILKQTIREARGVPVPISKRR